MGRRYYGIAKSYNDVAWQVELHNNSVATDFLLTIKAPKWSYDAEGKDGYNSIIPSRVTCTFFMRDETDYGNFVNISSDEEQQWVIKILRNGVMWWVGRVIADQMSWLREARNTGYASITLTAVDGLNLIEGYSMEDINFSIGDRQTVASTICQILSMSGIQSYWALTDTFVQDGIQTENANSAVGGPLDGSIRKYAFIKNKDAKPGDALEWMNCKEGLDAILTAWTAQIVHTEGKFILKQLPAHTGSSYAIINYARNGADISTGTYSYRHTIESAKSRPHFEAYATNHNLPPVRAVEAEFTRASGVFGEKTTSNTTTFTLTHDDIYVGNALPGHVIKVDYQILFDFYGPYYNYYNVMYKFYAVDGGTTYEYISGSWVVKSPVSRYRTRIYDPNWTAGQYIYNGVLEFVEPPSGVDSVVLELSVERIKGNVITLPSGVSFVSWTGAVTSAHAFTCYARIRQSYNTIEPYAFDQKANYVSSLSAPRDTNSKYLKLPCSFYNGKKYELGSYLAWSGAGYVEAGNWSAPWTSLAGDLPELLANTWAGVYANFINVIRGNLIDDGNYNPAKTLFVNSTIWYFNGGEFDAHNDMWNAEWLAVAVVYSSVNNNGQGERVLKEDDRVRDTINQMGKEVSRLTSHLGNVSDKLMEDIINSGTGAPTTDPARDAFYSVRMYYNYDSSAPALQWKIVEELEIIKSVDQSTTSDTGLSNDSELTFEMEANKVYNIKIMAYFTTGAGDFKYAITGPSAPTQVFVKRRHGDSVVTEGFDTGYTSATAITGISPGFIEMEIAIDNINAGTFAFQWAQNTSDGSTTKVHAGSKLKYIKQ